MYDTYMYVADNDVDDEERYLADYDPRVFQRPSLTVDVVVVGARSGCVSALLTRRASQPQRGRWGLPGGFVGIDEALESAAHRVLTTKGGLTGVYLEQLYTFGAPDRDPRTRVVTVAYMALVDRGRLDAAAGEGRCVADLVVPWEGEAGGPVGAVDDRGHELALAFDHDRILGLAVQRLRGKLDYAPVGFELLPERFTLRQLQDIHEAILGRRLNKDSFRRRMLAGGQLKATEAREENVAYRPAELYRFARRGPSGATERRRDG
jgi:8-oxo-dGTP diphosphatase